MNKFFSYLILAVIYLGLSNVAHAECTGDCLQYCGPSGSHGYCVDYIQYRLGIKQDGNAGNWFGNISASDVRPSDVAIFGPTLTNSAGHVAVVDIVDGDNITISEWNWGSQLNPPGNNCGVTNRYHIETTRTISKSSVTRFWRPTGVPASQISLPYRRVGNVAWNPPNKSCLYADRWVYYQNGYPNGGQSLGSNSICQQKEYEMMMALGGAFSNWWNVIYSPSDLIENGICSQ